MTDFNTSTLIQDLATLMQVLSSEKGERDKEMENRCEEDKAKEDVKEMRVNASQLTQVSRWRPILTTSSQLVHAHREHVRLGGSLARLSVSMAR